MTKTSALEALSRLGPISKLLCKIDDVVRCERLAFYVRDDQIIVFLYSVTNGVPTGVINVERVTAVDFIAADAGTNGCDIEPVLQRLGHGTDRTYKVIKTFHSRAVIYLLLEQTTDKPDAIVVGEVSEEDGERTIVLRARVEPQILLKQVQIAS